MVRRLITLAAASFLLVGCVGQDKYNALKMEKDAALEQLTQAQTEASAAKAARDALQAQIDALMNNGSDLQKLTAAQAKELAELRAAYDQAKKQYEDAMSRQPMAGGVVLPPEFNNKLKELAAKHGDVLEFDEARGMIKFKADVTFASGSAELTPAAKQAIAAFAQILNSPVAANYEFVLAGHTDNRPVSNPATIAAGHKDNWFLSAHRAISVSRELMSHNVGSRRLGVLGYADQRPIASNAASEGQTRNRRVECLILPTTFKGPAVADSSVPVTPRRVATPAPVRRPAPDLNKDTAAPDVRPVLQK